MTEELFCESMWRADPIRGEGQRKILRSVFWAALTF